MASAQVFSWEASEKGIDVHLQVTRRLTCHDVFLVIPPFARWAFLIYSSACFQAEPTKLELLSKEYQSKKDVYKGAEKDSILDKYGGKEHLEAPPKALLIAQTEEYVVYNR